MEQSLFHSKTAVIVVDMLNDFVKGELSCEQSRAIVLSDTHIALKSAL